MFLSVQNAAMNRQSSDYYFSLKTRLLRSSAMTEATCREFARSSDVARSGINTSDFDFFFFFLIEQHRVGKIFRSRLRHCQLLISEGMLIVPRGRQPE